MRARTKRNSNIEIIKHVTVRDGKRISYKTKTCLKKY